MSYLRRWIRPGTMKCSISVQDRRADISVTTFVDTSCISFGYTDYRSSSHWL